MFRSSGPQAFLVISILIIIVIIVVMIATGGQGFEGRWEITF